MEIDPRKKSFAATLFFVMVPRFKQGMERHSDDEVTAIGTRTRDLYALSDYLGSKPYFFGDKPSTLDAEAYGMLSQMILVTVFTAPLFDRAKSYKNLVEFTERFHKNYFQN